MKDKEQKAVALYMAGNNCAQSIFCAFCEDFGLDQETARRIASGFGGGFGGSREMCGALSGAAMVLGLRFGGYDVTDNSAKSAYYKKIRTLTERFVQKFETTQCLELLRRAAVKQIRNEPSERTPEYYKERPCAALIAYAAALLDEMLAQQQ